MTSSSLITRTLAIALLACAGGAAIATPVMDMRADDGGGMAMPGA